MSGAHCGGRANSSSFTVDRSPSIDGPLALGVTVKIVRLPPSPQTTRQQHGGADGEAPPAPLAIALDVRSAHAVARCTPPRVPSRWVVEFGRRKRERRAGRARLRSSGRRAESAACDARGAAVKGVAPRRCGAYVRGASAGGRASAPELVPGELGGKEAVIATWSLRRRCVWAEIKRAEQGETVKADNHPVKEDWCAQADLPTFSSTPRASSVSRPTSCFSPLGENSNALARPYQFAINDAKIDVRREAEVSACAFGPDMGAGGEAFVESVRSLARKVCAGVGGDDVEASALLEFDKLDEDFEVLPNASDVGGGVLVHADREDDDAISDVAKRRRVSVTSVLTPARHEGPIDLELDDAIVGE
ncbi:hypothetical protein B0H19DRAFT_1244586 [Mycena capillaripes]|nr:hypothetical protein B0H19DRAFT_1244586 [Mycena capillaripes]